MNEELNTALEQFLNDWRSDSPVIEAHTSGSTGSPKRILLSKSDMKVSAEATCQYFGISSNSLLFLPLSISYIAGKMMAVRSGLSGAELLVEKPSNMPLKQNPGREITLGAIVPSQVPGLLQSTWIHLVKCLIVGGAPLPPESEKLLVESGIPTYATYGMTETCSHVALRKLGQPVYQALPHIVFEVDDRSCLIVKSDAMSFKRLITNDVVSLIDDKTFVWHGRYDNVINTGGIKVFPEAIEAKLCDAFATRNFYITSRNSSKWGEEVVLVVEGSFPLNEQQVLCLNSLLPTERPKDIIFEPQFSYTESGKIIRRRR